MKKLLTTLALTFAVLLGGVVALAAPATAADACTEFTCPPPAEPGCHTFICPTPPPACTEFTCPPPACDFLHPCAGDETRFLSQRLSEAEQTANDYRAQVVALTQELAVAKARADRLQRVADRRAATIQHLRAVIRALR